MFVSTTTTKQHNTMKGFYMRKQLPKTYRNHSSESSSDMMFLGFVGMMAIYVLVVMYSYM